MKTEVAEEVREEARERRQEEGGGKVAGLRAIGDGLRSQLEGPLVGVTRGVEVRSVDVQAELPLPTTDTRALEETARMERERRAVQVGAPHSPSPPRPQHPPHPPLTQEERRRLEQVRRQEAAAFQERMEEEARSSLENEYRRKRGEIVRAREEVEADLDVLVSSVPVQDWSADSLPRWD